MIALDKHRLIQLLLASSVVLVLAQGSSAQDEAFTSFDGGFTISLPRKPAYILPYLTSGSTKGGAIRTGGAIYRWELEQGALVVSYLDGTVEAGNGPKFLKTEVDDFIKKAEAEGAALVYRKKISFAEVPGTEVELKLSDGGTLLSRYLLNSDLRLYVVTATWPEGSNGQDLLKKLNTLGWVRVHPIDPNSTGGGMGVGRGSADPIGVGAQGTGIGSGTANDASTTVSPPPPSTANIEPIKLLSRPRPLYTEDGRKAQVQGVVRLKIQFLADGSIGTVTPLNSLPYGLTEEAIGAARQIKFIPAKKDGVAITQVKVLEYSFTLY